MEYLQIKDIAKRFAIPERTVYDKVAKNSQIRTKKQWRTKFVNIEDFAKIAKWTLQIAKTIVKETNKEKDLINFSESQTILQKLQEENETVKKQSTAIQKINNNLETSLQKYAILLSEEKNEKKDILGRYEQLQKDYHIEQNEFHLKIQNFTKKYYRLIGISIVMFLIIVIISIPVILYFMGNYS